MAAEEQGLVAIGQAPPRPRAMTEAQARNWWMTSRVDLDMTLSAQSLNWHDGDMTAEQGQELYRIHFQAYVESRPKPSFTSVVVHFDALHQLAHHPPAFDDPKKMLQVMTCTGCGEAQITTFNGRHGCDAVRASMTEAGETSVDGRAVAKRHGIMTRRIVYPMDLIRHPLVGRDAWISNAERQLEQGNLIEIWRLESTDPSEQDDEVTGEVPLAGAQQSQNELAPTSSQGAMLVQASADQAPSTATSRAARRAEAVLTWTSNFAALGLEFLLARGLVIWFSVRYPTMRPADLDAFDGQVVRVVDDIRPAWRQHQVGHEIIRLRVSVFASEPDISIDDTRMWQSNAVTSVLKALKGSKPIRLAVCGHPTPCSYQSYASTPGQHACSTTGKRPRFVLQAEPRALCFADLPIWIQERLWFMVRTGQSADAIISWEATEGL